MKYLFIASLAVVALGCGKKKDAEPELSGSDIEKLREVPVNEAPPPLPPPAAAPVMAVTSDADYVAQDNELTKKMIEIYKADGSNCDKLATDITALAADPRNAAMTAYEQAHPDFQRPSDPTSEALTKVAKDAMVRVREACASNKSYRDALERF